MNKQWITFFKYQSVVIGVLIAQSFKGATSQILMGFVGLLIGIYCFWLEDKD